MSRRIDEVLRKTGVSVHDVQQPREADGPRTLVFNLQKITVKSSEYVKTLWLLGVDQNGYSVSVAVQDFAPTFLIKSPDTWDANDANAVDDLTDLVDTIHEATKGDGSPEKIKSVDFVLMTPFIGFSNGRKDRMVKFTCRNINDCVLVVKQLESMKFTLYHEDLRSSTPANQFIQQTGIEYQTWVEVSPIRYASSRMTHTSLEGYCHMENIHSYRGEIKLSNIPLLKAFVRMKAVSRDGLVEQKYQYRYNPDLPCDRLVAIGVYYSWHQDHTVTPCHSAVHTIIPTFEGSPASQRTYATEQEMLDAFRDEFVEWDPDEVFFFPDEFPTWEYYAARVQSQCLNGSALRLERFKPSKVRALRQNGVLTSVKFETRNMFNMEAALQKKVFISVESYDLYTCSAHKAFRKQPCLLKDLVTDTRLANRHLHKGLEGRKTLMSAMMQDLDLLIALELDLSMSGEYSNVSRASDTDLTDVVSRGEQIRVFNRLMRFNLDNHMYVNREKLGQKPLRFRISERPPTFKDPDELELNLRLRAECLQGLEQKLAYHNPKKRKAVSDPTDDHYGRDALKWFAAPDTAEGEDDDEDTKKHAADADEAEGGNVLKPSCRFWDDTLVCIYDFASLYPSIMMAFNLSYENLVFDEEYLDLPGVEYFTVPVNKYETVVTANVPGIIPKMLRTFVDNRSSIKKKMKSETDPFKKKTLDFEQNSMKVLCNGTYGFTGAEKRGALLAMKPIMYMVTGLGRYLQKFCTTHVGVTYQLPVIYGDTDSIFVLIGRLLKEFAEEPIERLTERVCAMFKMEEYMDHELGGRTWQHVVQHFAQRKKVDLTTFGPQHQLQALCYVISGKLTDELSDLIARPPVKLEFENLADKVWMSHAKKTYCYRFWSEDNPSKIAKIKITGMPVKKREWSPWTREVLMGVTERLLAVHIVHKGNKEEVLASATDRTAEIQTYLEKQLDRLVEGRVPIRELMVSKGFKSKSAYKHFRQVHLQVMLKMEQRTRWPVKEKTRLYFVMVRGNDQLYLRSETPEYAEEHKLELDLGYYLKNQFYNPMKKLLTYHPELFNFDELFKKYMKRLEMKDLHQSDLTVESAGKRRLLTEEDLAARFKKPKVVTAAETSAADRKGSKRKGALKDTQDTSSGVDPFARFLKKAK